jgi:hypothetical protein
MAIDFQVVFPQEAIDLTVVRIADNVSVRTLDVTGKDFTAVDQVLINGTASPSVVVVSKTRLLAQVPTQWYYDRITTVQVVSRRLMLTSAKSLIKFQIGPTPSKVRGILRLVQLFLKILFTSQGSDIFSTKSGGNGLRSIGATYGKDQGGAIIADFVVAVSSTQRQIIAAQSRDASIPRDERLLNAKVKSSSFNKNEAALIVSVELTSQAGRAALANVVI